MTYNANPEKLGKAVLNRISRSDGIINEPIFALYNLGRRLQNDCQWGEVYVSDVVGCNYRCAHCWVSPEALSGDVNSAFVLKKTSQFPGRFKGQAIHSADNVFDYLRDKARTKDWKVFAFTGGETSFYRGGLRRVSERARDCKENIAIGIDTNGWLISRHDDYLDAFDGLQDVMNFYVSIKGASPESFSRFTGVSAEHYDSAFKAIEKLLKKGFKTIPGGVVLNTIAYEEDAEKTAENLHRELARIHPQLPALVSYHKISTLVHDKQAQSKKMKSRGYVETKPSDFEKVLVGCFERMGTPIIQSLRKSYGIPGISSKDQTLQEIIADIRS